MDTLSEIHFKNIKFECLFCIDEAQVLREHLQNKIISTMECHHKSDNNDVYEESKRGTLSVLLYAIQKGEFAKKILLAGTSSKLRLIDILGTWETKALSPIILNHFTSWDSEIALKYVTHFVNLPRILFENILTDNYRPRILENFVIDLFCIANNDSESPDTAKKRLLIELYQLDNIQDILEESYNAVIARFTRKSIKPLAIQIRNHDRTKILLKLLLSSKMTIKNSPMICQLTNNEKNFFMDSIGSILLISNFYGYSFYEGYVINSLLELFDFELHEYNLASSLKILNDIIAREGKKTTAKGTAFESVVISELIKKRGQSVSELLCKFGVSLNRSFNHLLLPTEKNSTDDIDIISNRPLNVFMRPSNSFRPDILAFLSKDICLTFGIKLYTGEIPLSKHLDNIDSTDPDRFFSKKT